MFVENISKPSDLRINHFPRIDFLSDRNVFALFAIEVRVIAHIIEERNLIHLLPV